MSGLNQIFTGEIPQQISFLLGNYPVNFVGQNPGGESFPTFPSGGYAHGRGRKPHLSFFLNNF